MIDFEYEFKKAYIGNAWHGNNLAEVISGVNPEKAFVHPVPEAHSIAELVLHISSWTTEVISRLHGNLPKEPVKGDWRTADDESTEGWNAIVAEFNEVNEDLLNLIATFPQDQWEIRLPSRSLSEAGLSYFECLNGLIQHHAYHSGQIALLTKF